MLFSTKRRILNAGRIQLPSWIRAPLSLGENSEAVCYVDLTRTAERVDFLQGFISPFPRELWKDLWRIELEVEDKSGILSQVIQILNKHSIEILAAEGAEASIGSYHIMSIIISTQNYRSPRDGDANERAVNSAAMLKELEAEITVELIEFLRLSDRGSIKLKIRRLDAYWQISRKISGRDFTSSIVNSSQIKNGSVHLLDGETAKIREVLDLKNDANLLYSGCIDTKERVIRLIFFGESEGAPCYIQLHMPMQRNLLIDVLSCFSVEKHNIIRYQIRPSTAMIPAEIGSHSRFVRLDVTFSPDKDNRDREKMISNLKERISKTENFALYGAEIMQCVWAGES